MQKKLADISDLKWILNALEIESNNGTTDSFWNNKLTIISNHEKLFVLQNEYAPCGFVLYGKNLEILILWIEPDSRGVGYGSEAVKMHLEELMEYGRTMSIVDALPEALGFWEAQGYSRCSENTSKHTITVKRSLLDVILRKCYISGDIPLTANEIVKILSSCQSPFFAGSKIGESGNALMGAEDEWIKEVTVSIFGKCWEIRQVPYGAVIAITGYLAGQGKCTTIDCRFD